MEFNGFVQMVRRKIQRSPYSTSFKQLFQWEIDDILRSPDMDEEMKMENLKNLLRSLNIPIGVEGAGIVRRGRRRNIGIRKR